MAPSPAVKKPDLPTTRPKQSVARKKAAGVATPKPTTAPKKKAAPKKKIAVKPPAHPLMLNVKDWDRQAVLDVVCNAVASSSKAITSILAAGHEGHRLPDYATFARWLAEIPEPGSVNPYCDQYARAKEAQAEYMGEELAELHNKAWVPIVDDETGRIITGPDGKPLMTVDKASAAIVRLESDNKKWLMGKLKPKKYGDKVQAEVTGAGGGAVQIQSTVTFVRPPDRPGDD